MIRLDPGQATFNSMHSIMASTACKRNQDDGRCGYCLLSLEEIVDARVLACSHVFCVDCIMKDDRKPNELECPLCK